MLRCFLLILILAVSAGAQVPIGATKKEVIDKLGWPQSTSSTEGREILNYPDYTILLADGRVEKLQFKPVDSKRPKKTAPPSARPSPPMAKPVDTATVANAPITPGPRPAPVIQQSAPPTTSLKTPAQTPVTPASRPRPDPFAPIKTLVFGAILLLGIGTALKLWLRAQNSKNKGGLAGKFLEAAPDGVLQELSIPPKLPRRPDPLTDGWSLKLLKEIEWHRFEHLVAAYERARGNDAKLTGFGADGGIDVQVFEPGSGVLRRVIQCKAFGNQLVGVELVRAFYGAMNLQKVPEGAFYTTSGFSDDALAIGRDNADLELVDGQTFLSRIQQMPLHLQLKLFDVATEGDYTTPTCASCGVKMILRTARQGRNAGNDFWACASCRNTINIRRA